jgi:hypothetical protein
MYQKVCKATPHGLLKPGYVELKDPLSLLYDYEAVLEATLLNQIKSVVQARIAEPKIAAER